MGRLIPAGTGLPMYRKLGIKVADAESVAELANQETDEKLIEKDIDIKAAN
jgi:DNA-directed RNA polymerase subunit beta'